MKKNRKKIKRKTLFHDGSVNRWPNYLFNIWPFTTIKIGPMAFIICKNRLRILSNRDFKIFHKGEISPNLVTLHDDHGKEEKQYLDLIFQIFKLKIF